MKFVYIDYAIGMSIEDKIYEVEASNKPELVEKLRKLLHLSPIEEFECDGEGNCKWTHPLGVIRYGKFLDV